MNTMELNQSAESKRFREVGQELLELFKAQDVSNDLKLTRDESLPFLNAHPLEMQKQLVTKLEMMLALSKQTVARGYSIRSASAILETFFMNTGLSSIEGLFENVQDEDSIELFDTNHQLVFANLRCFQLVSYSIEDLFCRPWTDLLEREDPTLTPKLLNLGNEMLTGKRTKLTSTAVIPDHICYEKDSPELRHFKLIPNFFAPIYHSGQIAGYLCSNNIVLVDKP